MDPRCLKCPRLCKRMDSDEEPISEQFAKLTVRDVVELLPEVLTEYELWRLDILKQPPPANSDLKLLFKPKEKNNQEVWLTVSANDKASGGAFLTFQYQIPEPCSDNSPLVTELTELVKHSVDVLSYTDRLLAS